MISTTLQSFVVILYTNFELEILSCMFTIKTATWIVAALLSGEVVMRDLALASAATDAAKGLKGLGAHEVACEVGVGCVCASHRRSNL